MKLLTISLTLSLSTVLLADQQSLELRVADLEARIAKLEKHISSSEVSANQHPIIGKWTQEGIAQTMEFRADKTLIYTLGTFTVFGKYTVLDDGIIRIEVKDEEPKLFKAQIEGSLATFSEVDGSDAKVFVKSL